MGVRWAGCSKSHKPSEPSRLRLPQTHLEGENSSEGEGCSATSLGSVASATSCRGRGDARLRGDPPVGSEPGGPCRAGNHVPLGLGALREARLEARGSSHPPGTAWPGFSSGSGPQSSCPGGRFPAGAGGRGGRSRARSPEQMVPGHGAAPSASITRAGRLTIAFRG